MERNNNIPNTELNKYPELLPPMGRNGAETFDKMYENNNLIDYILSKSDLKKGNFLLTLGAVGGGLLSGGLTLRWSGGLSQALGQSASSSSHHRKDSHVEENLRRSLSLLVLLFFQRVW